MMKREQQELFDVPEEKKRAYVFIALSGDKITQVLVSTNPRFEAALQTMEDTEDVSSVAKSASSFDALTAAEYARTLSGYINQSIPSKFARDFRIRDMAELRRQKPSESPERESSRLLYCSFCGKSQHEVKKLVAGPSVFICDECIALTVDIVTADTDAPGNQLTRKHIEFPPEFVDFGVNVLAYFAQILKQKYTGQSVSVQLRQEENSVTLIIRHPDGKTDEIRKTLSDYGDIVMGLREAESLGLDPIQTLELKQKIKFLELQLENKAEMLQLKDQVIGALLPSIRDGLSRSLPPIQISVTSTSSASATSSIEVSSAVESLMVLYETLKNEFDAREALVLAKELRHAGDKSSVPKGVLDRITGFVQRLRIISEDVGAISNNAVTIQRAIEALTSFIGN